jgi:acyl carrier protein
MRNLLEVINDVLESNSMDTTNSLNDSMNLKDDLGFDSFMLAELTVEIEEETGVDIFADGVVNTIGDIRKKIEWIRYS